MIVAGYLSQPGSLYILHKCVCEGKSGLIMQRDNLLFDNIAYLKKKWLHMPKSLRFFVKINVVTFQTLFLNNIIKELMSINFKFKILKLSLKWFSSSKCMHCNEGRW